MKGNASFVADEKIHIRQFYSFFHRYCLISEFEINCCCNLQINISLQHLAFTRLTPSVSVVRVMFYCANFDAHYHEMESQAPPSKFARLSNSRTRLASGGNVERNRRHGESGSSPPIELGLELGRGTGSSQRPIISCKKPYALTVLQLQELQLQSLIYKYIQAGFPVPFQLVLPIWRSVATSLGGLSSRLLQLYPSLMGCSPLYLEYKNGVDPEMGRCRRTDGKKWRCSKEALPDQKYCDRHIHRGRQRSRKLEESTSPSNSSTNLSISLPGISSASAS